MQYDNNYREKKRQTHGIYKMKHWNDLYINGGCFV